MRRIDILILALMTVFLSGCRLKRPENVLSPKKMERFLYDYHRAQAMSQSLPREERYKTAAYVDWVYSKHGLSKESVERSLQWYSRYPKELAKIYKHISNRIENEYKQASRVISKIEKKSVSIPSGDSVDLWYLDRTSILNTSVYMDKQFFRLNRDTTFHFGDTVNLSLQATFVSVDDGVPQKAYINLSAYYSDSVYTVDTILLSAGRVDMRIKLDHEKILQTLSGSVNYLDETDNRSAFLIISDARLMRYHEKQSVTAASASKVSDASPAEL